MFYYLLFYDKKDIFLQVCADMIHVHINESLHSVKTKTKKQKNKTNKQAHKKAIKTRSRTVKKSTTFFFWNTHDPARYTSDHLRYTNYLALGITSKRSFKWDILQRKGIKVNDRSRCSNMFIIKWCIDDKIISPFLLSLTRYIIRT